MSTITFDILKFVERLEKAGVPREQAAAMSEAFGAARSDAQPVTKDYLDARIAPVSAELLIIKWMLGVVVAGISALILKTFF
ncbi:MAG: DUF1640 domain-containing protein [Pseudomonadota bacterium]|nr:DUF1640 domain-containing protein [Pseudomonadota bacterium]